MADTPVQTQKDGLVERLGDEARRHFAAHLRDWLPADRNWRLLFAADLVAESEGREETPEDEPEEEVLNVPLPVFRLARGIRRASEGLSPDQGLVIYAANRLGAKYLAGASTPYLPGKSGESDALSTRGSFTREELFCAVAAAGISCQRQRIFYPYPDLELPVEIFSDEFLPNRGSFTENAWDLCGDGIFRWQHFDEPAFLEEMVRQGLFGSFANAFAIVILPEESEGLALPDYVRFSDQRNPAVNIVTKIFLHGEDGKAFEGCVTKCAASLRARNHIQALERNCRILDKQYRHSGIRVEQPVRTDSGALRFRYLEGQTLEQRLDELASRGDADHFLVEADRFLSRIACAETRPFCGNEETRRLLGEEAAALSGQVTLESTDLDMTFSNVFLDDTRHYSLIDCEWTYGCPVPLGLVYYRTLSRYFETRPDVFPGIREELYERYGLTPERVEIFKKADARFQSQIACDATTAEQVGRSASGTWIASSDAKNYLIYERDLFTPRLWALDEADQKTQALPVFAVRTEDGILLEADMPSNAVHLLLEPALLPGTLTLPEALDASGRSIPVTGGNFVTEGRAEDIRPVEPLSGDQACSVLEASETAGEMSPELGVNETAAEEERQAESPAERFVPQWHFLSADPGLRLTPKRPGTIRLRFSFDASVTAGTKVFPLLGEREESAANTARRNGVFAELVALRQNDDRQKTRMRELDRVIASQQAAVEEQRFALERLEETLSVLTAERDLLREHHDDAAAQLEAMKASLSWRLTAPLRKLMALFRHGRT